MIIKISNYCGSLMRRVSTQRGSVGLRSSVGLRCSVGLWNSVTLGSGVGLWDVDILFFVVVVHLGGDVRRSGIRWCIVLHRSRVRRSRIRRSSIVLNRSGVRRSCIR
jgi:hypothetical protein